MAQNPLAPRVDGMSVFNPVFTADEASLFRQKMALPCRKDGTSLPECILRICGSYRGVNCRTHYLGCQAEDDPIWSSKYFAPNYMFQDPATFRDRNPSWEPVLSIYLAHRRCWGHPLCSACAITESVKHYSHRRARIHFSDRCHDKPRVHLRAGGITSTNANR